MSWILDCTSGPDPASVAASQPRIYTHPRVLVPYNLFGAENTHLVQDCILNADKRHSIFFFF